MQVNFFFFGKQLLCDWVEEVKLFSIKIKVFDCFIKKEKYSNKSKKNMQGENKTLGDKKWKQAKSKLDLWRLE